MEDVLIAILDGFGFPVYRQGAMSNDAIYPETFITYWNNSSPDHSHYDNADRGTAWNYTVNVYSEDSAEAYRLIGEIRQALKASGWTVPGKGYDIPSDEPTHTGRGIDCSILAF